MTPESRVVSMTATVAERGFGASTVTFTLTATERGTRVDLLHCDDEAQGAFRSAFAIGDSRSYDQDPRFGLAVLSEIGSRALSPATNDPGTAIDVIGRQARLLTLWSEGWHKAEGHKAEYPRLRVPPLRYDDICDDAFHLIARDGAGQIDVLTRLVKALDALRRIGPAPARQAADRQLRLAAERGLAGLPNDADRDRLRQVLDGLDRVPGQA